MRKGPADEILRGFWYRRQREKTTQSNGHTSQQTSGPASEPVGVCRLSPGLVGCALRAERPSGPADERLRAVSLQLHGPSGPTNPQVRIRVVQDRVSGPTSKSLAETRKQELA